MAGVRLICDERARRELLDGLGLEYSRGPAVTLEGHEWVHEENGLFYLKKTGGAERAEGETLTLSDQAVWTLDKVQSSLALAKERPEGAGEDCYTYVPRADESAVAGCVSLERARLDSGEKRQLDQCDIYLLIPGKMEKEVWDRLPRMDSQVFQIFKTEIGARVEEEYNSQFAKSLERVCVGQVVLEFRDLVDGQVYSQNALAGMVKHETGFCILELMVQNCAVGGNKLLNYYCGNMMEVLFQGERYCLDGFYRRLGMERFGKKRSMVFAYGEVTREEIINALANEEFPMGKIGGDFARKADTENIAQYDTAEVYVSHETMLEKCRLMDLEGDKRLGYHAMEIFFVELILLQDAAIDKVYVDLNREGERQRGYRDIQASTEIYEQLNFDMAQALRFGDYGQFNFPTVRQSAYKVAENFGLEQIEEKYRTNKELLGAMIQANKRKLQERQDRVKNYFLLLLSAMSAVGTLGDILLAIREGEQVGFWIYAAALLVVLCLFGVYKAVAFLTEKRKREETGKEQGK